MEKKEITKEQKRRRKDKVLIIITLILIFALIILSTFMYLTTNDFSKKVVKDEETTTTTTTTTIYTTVTNTTSSTQAYNTKMIDTTHETKPRVSYSFPDDVNNTPAPSQPIYKYTYELIGDKYKVVLLNTNGSESKVFNTSVMLNGEVYKAVNGVITLNKDIVDLSYKPSLVFIINDNKISVEAKEE